MDNAEITWWAIIYKDKILSKKHVGKQNTSNLITSNHSTKSQLLPIDELFKSTKILRNTDR